MDLPPPAAVAGRLTRTLVGRPYRALRPFLTEDASPGEGLLGEILTIVVGLLSFTVVTVTVALAAVGSVLYGLTYAFVALPRRLLTATSSSARRRGR